MPPRDWGRWTIPVFRALAGPDLGVFASAGLLSEGYAFRKDPYADRQSLSVGYATSPKAFRASYDGKFRLENSKLRVDLYALGSGIDILRFHGLGNQTPSTEPDSFYKVDQNRFTFAPALTVLASSRFDFSLGPIVKYAVTEQPSDKFIGQARPYGVGHFGQVGAAASLRLDTTAGLAAPVRGLTASAAGSFYPEAWDVADAFGEVHGQVVTYLGTRSVPLDPTLVLKGAGKRVWGTFPFYEAAFLGGSLGFGAGRATEGDVILHGLRPQRYAGDAAVLGSAELRLLLARAFILVPGDLGMFGFGDVGRVYLQDESSRRWHRGFGGGLWFTSPNRRNRVSLGLARSEGRNALFLETGFAF
jgi:hypothetical protein